MGFRNYFEQGNGPRVPNANALGRGVLTVTYSITY
jgi:hypothetical protein